MSHLTGLTLARLPCLDLTGATTPALGPQHRGGSSTPPEQPPPQWRTWLRTDRKLR